MFWHTPNLESSWSSTRRNSGKVEEWDTTHGGRCDCMCGWNTPLKPIPHSSQGPLFLHGQTKWHINAPGLLIIIGSSGGLSLIWRQISTQTNANLLPIRPVEICFCETSIKIHTVRLKDLDLNMLSAQWRQFKPQSQIIKTLGSLSIIHRSDTSASMSIKGLLELSQTWVILNPSSDRVA